MAMTPEGRIKKQVVAQLNKLGALYFYLSTALEWQSARPRWFR